MANWVDTQSDGRNSQENDRCRQGANNYFVEDDFPNLDNSGIKEV